MLQNIVNICAVIVALMGVTLTYIVYYRNTFPEIIAYLKLGEDKGRSTIYLQIENISSNFARDVFIEIVWPNKPIVNNKQYAHFSFFQPKAAIKYFFAVGHVAVQHPSVKVNIRYSWKIPIFNFTKKHTSEFLLNPKSFIGIDASDNSHLNSIASSLKNIEKLLKNHQ